VADNPAVGRYSDTPRGHEAGRKISAAIKELANGNPWEGEVHKGVLEALLAVFKTRPRAPGCKGICNAWPEIARVRAGVLLEYPVEAEAEIRAMEAYAKRPLETRCLYHW
jgi:hypothetical protein